MGQPMFIPTSVHRGSFQHVRQWFGPTDHCQRMAVLDPSSGGCSSILEDPPLMTHPHPFGKGWGYVIGDLKKSPGPPMVTGPCISGHKEVHLSVRCIRVGLAWKSNFFLLSSILVSHVEVNVVYVKVFWASSAPAIFCILLVEWIWLAREISQYNGP